MRKVRLMSLVLVLIFVFSAFSATAFAARTEYTRGYTHPGGNLKVGYYFYDSRVPGSMYAALIRKTPNGDVTVAVFSAPSGRPEQGVIYGTWYYDNLPAGTYEFRVSYPDAWMGGEISPSAY
jgi:hypothetical protein